MIANVDEHKYGHLLAATRPRSHRRCRTQALTAKVNRLVTKGRSKHRSTVGQGAVIMIGRERGMSNRELADAFGIDPSAVTRRAESASKRAGAHHEALKLRKLLKRADF